MKKWVKVLLIIVVIGILGAAGVVYYVYNRPHRDVTKEKGVQLSAQALYDAFRTNEADANKLYLDKAVEMTGEVAEVSTNQDGNVVVNFKTNDPLVVINCTFKENPGALQPGQTITFKGICTGYIPDANVVINEGILVK
jgi:flagellar basal body-associated protein FliL